MRRIKKNLLHSLSVLMLSLVMIIAGLPGMGALNVRAFEESDEPILDEMVDVSFDCLSDGDSLNYLKEIGIYIGNTKIKSFGPGGYTGQINWASKYNVRIEAVEGYEVLDTCLYGAEDYYQLGDENGIVEFTGINFSDDYTATFYVSIGEIEGGPERKFYVDFAVDGEGLSHLDNITVSGDGTELASFGKEGYTDGLTMMPPYDICIEAKTGYEVTAATVNGAEQWECTIKNGKAYAKDIEPDDDLYVTILVTIEKADDPAPPTPPAPDPEDPAAKSLREYIQDLGVLIDGSDLWFKYADSADWVHATTDIKADVVIQGEQYESTITSVLAVLKTYAPSLSFAKALNFNLLHKGGHSYDAVQGKLAITVPRAFRAPLRGFFLVAVDKNGKATIFTPNVEASKGNTYVFDVISTGYTFTLCYVDAPASAS